jgi:hypothetical protein
MRKEETTLETLGEMEFNCVNSYSSGQGSVVGSCEHGNEPSDAIGRWQFSFALAQQHSNKTCSMEISFLTKI